MFEFFLNPANMVLGGALISSPILIHLINRMRFRRVRWAAMEFLLKSQKRNRRRLIIEQLVLLALRVLLVLLAGLLLARFLGAAGILKPRNTLHLVVLDDRLSMGDHWKGEDGRQDTAFDVGKRLIDEEIARKLLQSRSAQRLVVRRLSSPSEDLFDRRLGEDSLRDLSAALDRLKAPTAEHLHLARGVQAARDLFGKTENAGDEHVLYLVSDFREGHWSGPEMAALNETLAGLKGVKVHLVDTAHPARGEGQRAPLYHDNLAVVELRPETRVAAEGMPVQFTVGVANYSPGERKGVRVTVKVDGEERPEGSLTLASVTPGAPATQTFQVGFVRPAGLRPEQPYFAVVTANLEDEEAGLQADNTRYAVIEVRRQVPVLLIDGDVSGGEKPGGDSFHLRALFSSARGYEVVRGGVGELERPNLDQYPSIYLLNVPELNDRALKNLEGYVRRGGSVAFFVGDRVKPEFYNRKLYDDGKGIFPAPLADRPTPAPTEEERQAKVLENLMNPRMQVFLRSDTHPIFKEVSRYKGVFQYVTIDRYFPVQQRKWNRQAREANHVEELATLPNERLVSDYEGEARSLLDNLPLDDPKYAKYRPGLDRRRRAIREALGGQALHVLARELEALLRDQGKPGEADQPNLKEFWEQDDPKIKALYAQANGLRERVQLGDPLVIVGRYGSGRAVVFLTTAGQKWNNWAGGPGLLSYPGVMLDTQKWLTSLEGETDRTVGAPLELKVDGARYEARAHRTLLQEAREARVKPAAAGAAGPVRAGARDLGDQSGTETKGELTFPFDDTHEPGVYLFDLTQRPDAGAEARKETRAFVVNVDALNESNLKRADRGVLDPFGKVDGANGGPIVEPKGQSDLSESAWIYLAFLVVLVAEQALAVHLSFHLKGSEDRQPGSAVRAPASAAA